MNTPWTAPLFYLDHPEDDDVDLLGMIREEGLGGKSLVICEEREYRALIDIYACANMLIAENPNVTPSAWAMERDKLVRLVEFAHNRGVTDEQNQE